MAIRRRLFASTPGYSVSAKQRSYGMPTRTLPTYPRYSRSGHYGDTRSEDTLLFDRVSQVSYLSDALLDEGYDTARRSRGRDQQLLREATNAIVSSESYATPQTSVASRRVARGRVIRAASVPPRSAPPAYSEAAIIASKLEPDPIKRRRPRSQFAADKLRNMRKEAQESVYTGTASAGMTASTPPLTGVEQRTSPVSELRRRIRKTLNKSRMSYS